MKELSVRLSVKVSAQVLESNEKFWRVSANFLSWCDQNRKGLCDQKRNNETRE